MNDVLWDLLNMFLFVYIWNYSKVVAPLTSLTSTLQAFHWTTKAEAAFVCLKS